MTYTKNLVEALADELERVVILREHYRAFADPRVLAWGEMMTAEINDAKRALGRADAVECLAALQALQGFTK